MSGGSFVRVLAATLMLAAACSSNDPSDGADPDPPPDRAADAAPLRVVTLNLLHGFFCPEATDSCQAPDRVQIFAEQVEAAGCPDLIGLQEIGTRLAELMPSILATLCEGEYEMAWAATDKVEQQMVLSRRPIIEEGHIELAHFPWEAYWVRVDAEQGPVEFLTAHFASSANNPPCVPEHGECPSLCPPGMVTNECHAAQIVDFFAERTDSTTASIASGDFNAAPNSPTVRTLREAGFTDAWVAAGQPECDPQTHVGCTGGGDEPEPFEGMDTEQGPRFDERIDYVMVRPGPQCELRIDAEAFAAQPRAAPLNGMWWPSDHAGVLAQLSCAS